MADPRPGGAGAALDAQLIEQYVASAAFQTSFLPTDSETGIHGPFEAGRITAAGFIRFEKSTLGRTWRVWSIRRRRATTRRSAKMSLHLRAAFEGGRRCYVLRRDERDRELFHEWGGVLSVFREFLFIGPERDSVERFVIGYD